MGTARLAIRHRDGRGDGSELGTKRPGPKTGPGKDGGGATDAGASEAESVHFARTQGGAGCIWQEHVHCDPSFPRRLWTNDGEPTDRAQPVSRGREYPSHRCITTGTHRQYPIPRLPQRLMVESVDAAIRFNPTIRDGSNRLANVGFVLNHEAPRSLPDQASG
jgi:hypothetical protein